MIDKIIRGISYFIIGGMLLAFFSTFQKMLIGASLELKGYIVPIVFGGITGLIIGLRSLRLKNAIKQLKIYEEELERKIEEKTRNLEAANKELSRLALIDGLTHVPNRIDYESQIVKEWSRWKRAGSRFSVLLCDVDYFKKYNDTYGHLKGDDCLISVASALNKLKKRPNDYIARYGGEEFILLFPGTDIEDTIKIAESACKAVEFLKIEHKMSNCSNYVTISIGLATTEDVPEATDYKELVDLADQALYLAKEEGRNRVKYIGDHAA